MNISLPAVRGILDSAVPVTLATCSMAGEPNVTYVSQVEYVDAEHVALSFQFFNKTRENILAHPFATAYITDSDTAASYRISLRYVRTETEGRVFERMKAKLAGIASHTGMAGVFKLLGADVYRVLAIEAVPVKQLRASESTRRPALPALREACERLARCHELASLLDETLVCLDNLFGITHSMLLLLDENERHLYTVASRGYAVSGVGSEIALSEGVIGVAAAQRTPIRIAYMTSEYGYGRALRASALEAGLNAAQAEIPFPGLAQPHSQMAVPILASQRLLGVLYVESTEQRRFGYDEEDALVTLATQLAVAMTASRQTTDSADDTAAPISKAAAKDGTASVRIRHYQDNDVIFIDDDYLIKGVAGAIFWKLVSDYTTQGRVEFSNKELRLARTLRLPDVDDNLEARLILLARRLAERCDFLAIEKTGRGRFRLRVDRPLALHDV